MSFKYNKSVRYDWENQNFHKTLYLPEKLFSCRAIKCHLSFNSCLFDILRNMETIYLLSIETVLLIL